MRMVTVISVTIIKEDDDDTKADTGSVHDLRPNCSRRAVQGNPARFHDWVGNPMKSFRLDREQCSFGLDYLEFHW